MGWQDYTVGIIGLAVATILVRRVICLFRERGNGGCGACTSVGCPIQGAKGVKRKKRQ